ncbi:MAG TPA: hypothetical protein VHL30_04700, partial [Chlamydiales bacterium]|jgi:FKBP-type peptidyl-prolyl cis-trans isomerase (trigger factor)|nr:hypothetical protein [Chlamydiales bacterium]
VREELREQVNDFLIKKYSFELPHSLVETEKKHRLQQLSENPEFQEKWQKMTPEEQKKIEANLEAEASEAIRIFYLSRKVVNEAKIPITHKEIQDEAITTLRSVGKGKMEKIPKQIYALALSKIILLKAQNYILGSGETVPLSDESKQNHSKDEN